MPENDKWLISISPGGEVKRTSLDAHPTLDQLKDIVGGYIELIPYFNKFENKPCIAFCNEMGKLHELPVNLKATNLWIDAYGGSVSPDYLVGSIAIVVGPRSFLNSM
jgi:hypothetical protein